MLFLAAILALPLILYIPGLLISHAVPGALADADALELHYERVVISTLLSGWLALTLAEFGLFSLWLHLAIVLVVCGVVLQRLVATHGHAARPMSLHLAPRPSPLTLRTWHFPVIGLIALWLVLPPFEVVLGVRDAGVYANTGFAIARTGGVVQYDELVAELGQAAESNDADVREPAKQAMSNFLGVQHPERFIATRMRAAGFFINEGDAPRGRVVGQGLHLLPAWIALLTSIIGVYGGLWAPGLMGVLGAWSVGMLGRRLAGHAVGALAFLFLALNSVQVWFSRYSTSETTTQFLAFAGLYCFAKFQACNSDTPLHASLSSLSSVSSVSSVVKQTAVVQQSRAIFYAILAGLAFGQLALTRIDFFLVVGPVLLYLLYCLIAHRWSTGHTALSVALGTMLLHAGLHIIFIARAYFFDTAYARLQDYAITAHLALPFITPILREVYHTRSGSTFKDPLSIWRELSVVAVGVGALLALWRWPKPLHSLATFMQRWRKLLTAIAAIGILALGGHAYLIRPQIITPDMLAALPTCFNPRNWNATDAEVPCLQLQGYVGAPIAIPEPQSAIAAEQVKQEDTAQYYRAGLQALVSHMGPDHPRYEEALAYKQQLLELVAQVQQQGEMPALQQTGADIMAHLDELSYDVVDVSFDELCALNIRTPKKDAKYVIPKANLVRIGWYLLPLGVVLGVCGFALWWWDSLNRASWLFLVVGLLGTFFYVRQTYGTSDQTYIYILRRFVAITYPTFSLGIAYALWRIAGQKSRLRVGISWGLALLMVAFFVWTGRPIYRHTEYDGAVRQLADLADSFDADAVLLFRGGAPTAGQFRDVPDLVTTPLHFLYGLDALTVKSGEPGRYAAMLAEQVRHWQESGRSVYLVLSASGGDVLLPGFTLQPMGYFTLDLPEFEQLSNQKPHNVASLTLPFALYRLDDAHGEHIGGTNEPNQGNTLSTAQFTAHDFAAQVQGFYLAEGYNSQGVCQQERGCYAWTDGNVLLRLPLLSGADTPRTQVSIQLAGGQRPSHMGDAQVCLSFLPEEAPWPTTMGDFMSLGCVTLTNEAATYTFVLDAHVLSSAAMGNVLLRLESDTWVPAEEDRRQHDQRRVGVQFFGVQLQIQ